MIPAIWRKAMGKYLKRTPVFRSMCILTVIIAMNQSIIADSESENPNDPLFHNQQKLFERLNVFEAWKFTKGDPNVLIGVIDNGFDFFHPDLKGNLIPGFYANGGYHTECPENIIHGTLVSSIIVAKNNNKVGMTGLAPHCRILTASLGTIEHEVLKFHKKFIQDHPGASPEQIQKEISKDPEKFAKWGLDWQRYQFLGMAEAICYLVDHGAKVINISIGGWQHLILPDADQKKIEDAFQYAASKNVVIVIAAGNTATMCENYPGDPNTMIVAGATLLDDTRWEKETTFGEHKIKQGSDFGKRLTVMAPVENIQVCLPHEKRFYKIEDGPMGSIEVPFGDIYDMAPSGATSSAAPIVTSLVALVYSIRPDLDAKSVVDIIKQGCDDIGEQGFDIYTGYGRVNFGKTVKIVLVQKK